MHRHSCAASVRAGASPRAYHGDIVVFDEATIAPGPIGLRGDLPGGARRLYADAIGIHHVLVNGTEIVRDGTWTGALPGSVLRPEK